jgi:hypothetical protein
LEPAFHTFKVKYANPAFAMADTESKEINVAVPEVEPETTVEPVSQPVVVCEKIQATKPTSVKEETKSENLAKKNGHGEHRFSRLL